MVVLLSLAACTDDTEYTAGVWYRRSDFDGVARTDAAGFTIGNVGYLCTGYRGSTKDRLKDCWAYDIEANSWTQCTSMPDAAPARNAATGFAVGTKGYIATGYDATKKDYLNDCWQYDPATNSWKEMASIPDGTDGTNIYGKRYYALSFGMAQHDLLHAGLDVDFEILTRFAACVTDVVAVDILLSQIGQVDESHAPAVEAEQKQIAASGQLRKFRQIGLFDAGERLFRNGSFAGLCDAGIDIGEKFGVGDRAPFEKQVAHGAQIAHVK